MNSFRIMVFNHSLVLSNQDLTQIYEIVSQMLVDPQLEVRELARVALSSILRSVKTDVPALIV